MDLFYFEPRTAEVCRFFGFGDTLEMVGIPRFTRDKERKSPRASKLNPAQNLCSPYAKPANKTHRSFWISSAGSLNMNASRMRWSPPRLICSVTAWTGAEISLHHRRMEQPACGFCVLLLQLFHL